MWPFRKRWSVRLIGLESGLVHPPLTFLRFRSREAAERWIAENAWLNDHHPAGLTIFEPVDLRTYKAERDT